MGSLAVKNIRVEWRFVGDQDSYRGFNVAICEKDNDPIIIESEKPTVNPIYNTYIYPQWVGVSGAFRYSFRFTGLMLDLNKKYDVWIQACLHGMDTSWVNLSGDIVLDDGNGTILQEITPEDVQGWLDQKIDPANPNSGNIVQINPGNIPNGTITNDHIVAGTITANKINVVDLIANGIKAQSAWITGDLVVNGEITTDKLAANSVTSVKIKADSITADKIQASSTTTTKLLSQDATISSVLTIGPTGEIRMSDGNIFAKGSVTAGEARIANWYIGPGVLRSNKGTAGFYNRIELDQAKSRISIFDDSNTAKVAMGFLQDLPKNDGSGNWTASDYGFWAKKGDKLRIDGDGEYVNGDWLISHDAGFVIENADKKEIVRLGSENGIHGVHIKAADVNSTKLAEFSSAKILVGTEALNGTLNHGLRYTAAGGLEIVGKITVSDPSTSNLGLNYNNVAGKLKENTFKNPSDVTVTIV